MKTKIPFTLFLLVFASTLVACAPKGFETQGVALLDSNNNSSKSDEDGSGGSSSLQTGDLEGNVDGGFLDRYQVIEYLVSKETIRLHIPIMSALTAGSGEIPKIPGSHFEIAMDTNGYPELLVDIPAAYILGHLGFQPDNLNLDPTRLPNGQTLPASPGGEPPKVSFKLPIKGMNIRIYAGFNVIGVYMESDVNPVVDLTFAIRNKSKLEILGYFSTISKKNSFKGGFYLAMLMPPRIAAILENHIIHH